MADKTANTKITPIKEGDSAAKILSAKYQGEIAGAIERLSQFTLGGGADVVVTGPLIFKKRPRASSTTTGASVVAFTIDTADCDNLTATGTVTRVACNLADPAVGDSIDLVDVLGCMLTGDPVGLSGLAVKMENPYGYDCEWVIQTLCCNAEMC